MSGQRRPLPPTSPTDPRGAHFLRSGIAASLVRASAVGSGDLVLDLGARLGSLTRPLAAIGAHVVAVERDARYVRRLTRIVRDLPNVTVVCADIRTVHLPRRDFHVVANLPFATTEVVLHRLLDPPRPRLVAADLVVRETTAGRLVSWSRSPRGAWWGARYVLRRGRRLGPQAFQPSPSVTAAVLVIRRVPLSAAAERVLAELLRHVQRRPAQRLRTALAGRLGPRQLRELNLDPAVPLGLVDAAAWRLLASAAVGEPANSP